MNIYIYIYVYNIHIHVHIHKYVHIHIYIHILIHIQCFTLNLYIYTYICICIYIYTHTHTRIDEKAMPAMFHDDTVDATEPRSRVPWMFGGEVHRGQTVPYSLGYYNPNSRDALLEPHERGWPAGPGAGKFRGYDPLAESRGDRPPYDPQLCQGGSVKPLSRAQAKVQRLLEALFRHVCTHFMIVFLCAHHSTLHTRYDFVMCARIHTRRRTWTAAHALATPLLLSLSLSLCVSCSRARARALSRSHSPARSL